MKKLFTLIVCAVLSIGARAQFSGSGNGTESNPYLIYNVYQLAQMANFLNQEGVVFELKMDIDMSDFINENNPSQGWDPIGVESTPFRGVLKGNNHTISGLYVKRTNIDNIGLFGYVSGATIQDLTINASSIEGKNNVGTFVGYSATSILKNITITVSGSVKGNHNVGGGIGYASSCNLDNAMLSTNQVEGTTYVGGVIGYANGCDLTNADFSANQVKGTYYVGGVIGYTNGGTITTCNSTCDVTSTSNVVGGIVGYLFANTVSAAKATGNVSGTTSVGGGFGQIGGTCTLNNVTSIGDIDGTTNVSGIAGELTASSIVTFASCFSKGKITNSGDYTGGIVGKSCGICINSMDDCTHFGDIKGENYVGGLIGAVLKNDAASPTLDTYEIRASASSTAYTFESYSDQLEIGGTITQKLNNCTAIGDIEGIDYVGGLVGESLYATLFTRSSSSYEYEYPRSSYGLSRAIWKNGVFDDYYEYYKVNSAGHQCWAFPRTVYTKHVSTISLENSYYSGNISASKYAGGLIGHKVSGDIKNCYTYSTINGTQYVGGIVGLIEGYSSTHRAVVRSTIANNASVTATTANVGRIYGASGGNITIGALASPEGNRALAQTNVVLSGVAQDIIDDEQNGTSVGSYMLKLKANYVSWGWNFDENWKIEETECYPYKKYQAAPPVILSELESHDTKVSGKAMDSGTVYMLYKNNEAVSTVCNGHDWTFTTEELQSGAQVKLYTEVDGLVPSYYTTGTVEYPGSGTEDDPYRIYTADDLQGAIKPGYYKVMNDIDLTSWIDENSPIEGWKAIGRNSSLATYIDGDYHKITGLWMETYELYNGLFSSYDHGCIKNLTVIVADGKQVMGREYTGILVGKMTNGEIINCHVSGEVDGVRHVGGLVGWSNHTNILNSGVKGKVSGGEGIGGLTSAAGSCEVENCFFDGTVNSHGGSSIVGGLIGDAQSNIRIEKCFANANISTFDCYACGGLVGRSDDGVIRECYSSGSVNSTGNRLPCFVGGLGGYLDAHITNCYSTANVSGGEYSAGLVAYCSGGKIDKCYASGNVKGTRWGGGLVGQMYGVGTEVTNSFAMNIELDLTAQESWASRVIGGYENGCADPIFGSNFALSTMQVTINGVPQTKYDDSVEGVAKTESELKSAATYSALGWDMGYTWLINEGKSYPVLAFEASVPTTPDEGNEDDDPEEGGEDVDDPDGEGTDNPGTGGDEPSDEPSGNPDNPSAGIEQSTDIASFANVIYFNDTESKAGSFNLDLNMKNAEENITAFQCDVYLPEGVEWTYTTDKRGKVIYNLPAFNEDRTDNSYHTITPIAKNADGSYNIIVYSMDLETILETDGVLMMLPLEISEEMEAGEYNIILKNIVMTDVDKNQTLIDKMVSKLTIPSYQIGDANGDDLINVTDIVTTIAYIRGDSDPNFIIAAADTNEDGLINVTDIVGMIEIIRNTPSSAAPRRALAHKKVAKAAAESNLQVVPFTVAEGTTSASVKLNLNNPGEEFTAFQCDVVFPEGVKWETTVDKRGKEKYSQPTFDAEADRTDASYHKADAGVTSEGNINIMVYSMDNATILDEEGAVLDLPFVFDEGLAPGTYDITIKNVVLTRPDKTDCKPADYTFTILVGSPEVTSVNLHGNITDQAIKDFNKALETNETLTAIDMSEAVNVSSETAIKTGNENLLIYTTEGMNVKNGNNVVSGSICDNLIITDSKPFSAPKTFTAAYVSYSRSVANKWGTICLPYAISSCADMQLYKLGKVEGNALTFEPVETLDAGEPAVFKISNASSVNLNDENVLIAAGVKDIQSVDGMTLVGSLTGETIAEDEVHSYYYVAKNKVWPKNPSKDLTVLPQRAYFVAQNPASAKEFNICADGEESTAIRAFGEIMDGTAEYYDANGRRISDMQKGVNIVRTADGNVTKVIIK